MTLEQRQYAIQRTRAKRQFWLHVAFLGAMAVYFVLLWARSSSATFWPIWALFGWGIGLVAHAQRVYGWERSISDDRNEREIDRSR